MKQITIDGDVATTTEEFYSYQDSLDCSLSVVKDETKSLLLSKCRFNPVSRKYEVVYTKVNTPTPVEKKAPARRRDKK